MIPKILHFIWMQGLAAMPTEYRRCFDSWAPKHPDWEIKCWSRDSLPTLENDWAWSIDNPTVQTDVARIEVVYQHGGIYLDADMECLRPLDELAERFDAFASKRNKIRIENAGFGATPQHPWLRALIDRVAARRDRIKQVLDMDKPFNDVTKEQDIYVIPERIMHPIDDERSRAEFHEMAYAIHHRFGLWKATDPRHIAEAARKAGEE